MPDEQTAANSQPQNSGTPAAAATETKPDATASAEASATTATTEADAAAAAKSGEGDGKTTQGEGDGKTGDDTKSQGAPEKYEAFTAPEGVAFNDAVMGTFQEAAKELNLTQDAAQKLIDKVAPTIAQSQLQQFEAARQQVHAEWADQAKNDKEFGGEQFAENLAVAKKARDTFFTPEFNQFLEESGLGNHPEMIRGLVRAGKQISEDGHITAAKPAKGKGDARGMYPNSNHSP